MPFTVPGSAYNPDVATATAPPATAAASATTGTKKAAGNGTYTSIIPGLDVYGPAALAANTAYQTALARINMQRSGLLRQYGYTGAVDKDSGTISNVAVDPNNPYGALQQMLNSQSQEDEQAAEGAQNRGLVGGLAHKMVSALRYGHGAQSANLGTQLFGGISGLQGTQDDAYNTMANSLWQAQLAQAQLALQNQQFNPADPSADDSGDSGQGSTTTDYVPHPQALSPELDPTPTKTSPNAKAKKPVGYNPQGYVPGGASKAVAAAIVKAAKAKSTTNKKKV